MSETADLTLRLPWPPKDLSPNGRVHWAKLAKAKRLYRQTCWAEVASLSAELRQLPEGKSFDLLLRFLPPNRRSYDRDNLASRMKSGIDGVCQALGIDDSRFRRVTSETGAPVKMGLVEMSITESKGDTK